MPNRGDIVLTAFPFTDLSGEKRRPALVMARSDDHIIVLFITSKQTGGKIWRVPLAPSKTTGLKVPSAVRVDKILSIDTRIVTSAIGSVPTSVLPAVEAKLKKLFAL